MSEQEATASMAAVVDMLTSRRGATPVEAPDRETQQETALPTAAEYWSKRIMWFLVAATSLWDIAETFDKHFPTSFH
jgi:hypothetical protein